MHKAPQILSIEYGFHLPPEALFRRPDSRDDQPARQLRDNRIVIKVRGSRPEIEGCGFHSE
jgi:hypothetical protein